MKPLLSICLFVMASMVKAQKIPASDFFIRVDEINSNEGVGIIAELLSRIQGVGYIAGEKPVGSGHYATHNLNNELRELHRCSVSYIPGGYAFKAPYTTGITLTEIVERSEYQLPGSIYPLRDWDDQPFYLLDELVAYYCGTLAGIEAGMADTGRVRGSYREFLIVLHHVRIMIDITEEKSYPHVDELELLYQHFLRLAHTIDRRIPKA